ncbi:hypothetical protein Tco_0994852 [Tanacetum coccineum]
MCQTHRQIKRGWDTKIPQSSGPLKKVGDEAVHKELGDRMERVATTVSSLEAEQDSDAQTRFETASIMSNDPPLSRGNTLRSEEDNMQLMELMAHCTTLSELKSEGSAEFHQIIDFLTASHIKYALTENPKIYVSFIQQFWETATASTNADGKMELTARIDGQEKTITEASLRRHLKLEDSDGLTSLPNTEIFEQLALMGNMKRTSKGYSKVVIPLFPTMITPPESSPSRITSLPSSSPQSHPSPQTHDAEEPITMSHDSALPRVQSLESDEGSLSLNELTVLCPSLSTKVQRSGYQQKDRKPSQNDKTEHGMEKTVQNRSQSQSQYRRINSQTGAGTEEYYWMQS